MKRRIYIFAALLLPVSCLNLQEQNPYSADLHTLSIELLSPEESAPESYAGTSINIREINTDLQYSTTADASGIAGITLPNGLYMATTSLQSGDYRYGGSVSGIVVGGSDVSCSIQLSQMRTSDIVIKEVYCGGCMRYPQEGTYQGDAYFLLHNNSTSTVYLDGLCFGTVDPYNSNATSVWESDMAFVPIIQAVWQFPGEGEDFPLAPGEDAIVAVYGAIDHSAYYPMSVNLNREDVFVCYNSTYFPNTNYHPAPGDRVQRDRYLEVVIKTGQANAYTFSLSSPALVIFRAEGQTIQDFVAAGGNVIQKPGSTSDRVVCVPYEWIMDGVEVFNGCSSSNKKRLGAQVDASYVTLSRTFEGYSLMRRTDGQASAAAGIEVLQDTNNSIEDFYERFSQSLHE